MQVSGHAIERFHERIRKGVPAERVTALLLRWWGKGKKYEPDFELLREYQQVSFKKMGDIILCATDDEIKTVYHVKILMKEKPQWQRRKRRSTSNTTIDACALQTALLMDGKSW